MRLKKLSLVASFATLFVLASTPSLAQSDAPAQDAVEYIKMTPSVVVNMRSSKRRLQYMKTDISLRVNNAEHADKVKHHMPLLRDRLLLLLSSKSYDDVNSMVQREALRKAALEVLTAALEEEESAPLVDNLLFTSFVLQK